MADYKELVVILRATLLFDEVNRCGFVYLACLIVSNETTPKPLQVICISLDFLERYGLVN